jgi:uncharacterized membrane protein YfcA
MLEWYYYPIMIIAGFAAGFINTLAGSGSILTLPLLLYLGLPANMANATNRVGIVFQNTMGTAAFHRNRMLDFRGALILGIPAVLGSIIGAAIAVSLEEATMRTIIGIVMVFMAILMVIQSERWLIERALQTLNKPKWWHLTLMFIIGVYGGFIQLGVGIFLLVMLVMGVGYDTVRGNAVKMAVILLLNLAALVVFQGRGQVNWPLGLILALGSMLGAWVAARFAIQWGSRWIYRFLVLIVIFTALDLLGIFKLVGSLLSGLV